LKQLQEAKVSYSATQEASWIRDLLMAWLLPLLLLYLVWRFFAGRTGPEQGALAFGRTKAKLYAKGQVTATFEDVAGVDEAKEELQEIIEFLRHPQKYQVLGGRVAEELIFNEVSTGAQDDLARATDIARRMVKEYGMSEALGPVAFDGERRPLFMPPGFAPSKEYAEATALAIDREVAKLLQEARARANDLLSRRGELLHRLAKLLLEREVIEGTELRAMVAAEAPVQGG
jgi:ATP-dependent Zn protease